MAFTTERLGYALAAALLLTSGPALAAWPGLPTRDQNPLLQGYLIPVQPSVPENAGWSGGLSLFITNTYQSDRSTRQQLLIDVETTRLDLQFTLHRGDWQYAINLPLIDNRGGQLDRLILDWHDFFGLPQGGRDQAPLDDMALNWTIDGSDIVNVQHPVSGIGDIQLSVGRKLDSGGELWLAVELPSGTDALISNEGIDLAFWWARQGAAQGKVQGYGSLGVSLIHDSGLLEGHLRRGLLFGQAGLRYRWNPSVEGLLQIDAHSALANGSQVDGLDASLQGQFGLRFPRLIPGYRLDLYFSEDIWPGHAPDISFALTLSAG